MNQHFQKFEPSVLYQLGDLKAYSYCTHIPLHPHTTAGEGSSKLITLLGFPSLSEMLLLCDW
jgi:hypothetical protein